MRGACKMHQTVTETAKRLMDQLAKTGAYRPADLCLVLGNPRDAVQPPTGDSVLFLRANAQAGREDCDHSG